MKNTILILALAFSGFVALIVLNHCNLKGCLDPIEDTGTKVTAALDRGISELAVASADWQDILNKVIDELPDEVQSTVTNEVSNLLNRATAAVGVEARCNVDFLRNRLRQGLQRIRADFLGIEMPPLEPALCNVVPLAIDMDLEPGRRNKIEFYGYDFDKTNIEVIHVHGNSQTNVATALDQPTHYHMTLNLGGSGVPLDANSKRIILRWNNRDISSIAVIQPSPEICETDFDNFRPGNITVIPLHATMPGKNRGDKEFDGHGPRMYCSVRLHNLGNKIETEIFVTAGETKSDWTYGKALHRSTVYTVDPGYVIEQIIGPTLAYFSYTDNDHKLDEFAGSGPVQTFIFNGDGSGKDIERNTKVTVQFNPIRIQKKQTGDCVSNATVRALENSGMISTVLKTRVESMRTTNQLRGTVEIDRLINP